MQDGHRAFGGTLRDLNAASLSSVTMKEAVARAGIEAEMIMIFDSDAAWNRLTL